MALASRQSDAMRIERLVEHFRAHEANLSRFLTILREFLINSEEFMGHIHSIKWRIKDSEHLRDKLHRKAMEAREKKQKFHITKENLFEEVNDLVGIRILYLYTNQFPSIDSRLRALLHEGKFPLFEEPFARSWDRETEKLFSGWGIRVEDSESMYTSVHYVVEANQRTRYTCEIQVRTLMEEVWGEVDHSINYPHKTASVACAEQIRALARLTSGCTRLVDSIYRSDEEYQKGSK